MKNMIKYNCVLFGLILLSSCCKDMDPDKRGCQKDKPTKETGPFPLGLNKDYLYFKAGSWWVYENNLTSERDSIVVISCDTNSVLIKEEYPSAFYKAQFTALSMRQKSYTNGYNIFYDCNKIAPDNYHFIFTKAVTFPSTTEYSIPYVYPYLPESYFIELIPSVLIKGELYTEVLVFSFKNDHTILETNITRSFRGEVKYYWARGNGLIKYEAHSNNFNDTGITEVWELVNKNLIK